MSGLYTVTLPRLAHYAQSFAEDIGIEKFNVRLEDYIEGEETDTAIVTAPSQEQAEVWAAYVSNGDRRS